MVAMVKMQATGRMRERDARNLQYRTRMLTADILAGQEFEVSPSDARILSKAGWATAVPSVVPRRRGRPPKAAAAEAQAAAPEPQPEQAAAQEPSLDDLTREELIARVEERGIEMPPGYVSKPTLIELLGG